MAMLNNQRVNFPICRMNMGELSYLELLQALAWNVQAVSISRWISKEESGKRQF